MKKIAYAGFALMAPLLAFAQTGHTPTAIEILINNVIGFINGVLVPLVFAVAFIVFLYGVFNYFILGGADDEKRKKGRKLVMWSVIGFAIMFSLWGIVNLVVQSFGYAGQARPSLPIFDPSNPSATR